MNMGGVSGQEHTPLAVLRCLERAVGPGRHEMERSERHVRVGHAPQHRLHVLESDRLRAMRNAAVEVRKREKPGLRLRVIASRSGLPAHTELLGVGDVYMDGITRELRLGPDELEATLLADGAATAVASHQEAPAKTLRA